jgi:transcriptional regulator with XRE-family HTH domain
MSCHRCSSPNGYMTSPKNSFPIALKTIRKARGLSQEAFSDVSSRTYMSSLERGLKSPTLTKVAEVCEVMNVHPLTLLALAYADDSQGVDKIFARVQRELANIHSGRK